MNVARAYMHMQRANELMAAFGQPKDSTLMKAIEKYKPETREIVLDARKMYLVKVVEHLLNAFEKCKGDPIKVWISHSFAQFNNEYASSSEPYFHLKNKIIPGASFADIVHACVHDPGSTGWWDHGESLTSITKRLIGYMSIPEQRKCYDNKAGRNTQEDDNKKIEPYTSVEKRLAEISILCLSLFMLAAQHNVKRCGCEELPSSFEHVEDCHRSWFFEEEEKEKEENALYFRRDKPWAKHDCDYIQMFNKMLYDLTEKHMEHIAIDKKENNKSLYQTNYLKMWEPERVYVFPFEFTRSLSSMTLFMSEQFANIYNSYTNSDSRTKRYKAFVLNRQENMQKRPDSTKDWELVKTNTERCLKIIYDVAMAMYYVRFFLKGHEGTKRSTFVYNKLRIDKFDMKSIEESYYPLSRCPRVKCEELIPSYHAALQEMKKKDRNPPETVQKFERMMTKKPQGRLPEGTLNFHELQEADESKDTAAARIYADLVSETKGMFDTKNSGKIACEEAQKIAESMYTHIEDKVQSRLMTDITMWALVFGSCLDAYGMLDKVKSKSHLWKTIKEKLQSTHGNSTASQKSGAWTCT